MDGIPLGPSYAWKQARDSGVTRRQIAAAGVPLARGLYLSRAVDLDLDLAARCAAWATVLPADAVFGLQTATALFGVAHDPGEEEPLHVVLTPRRVLPQHTGLVVHARRMRSEDVVAHRGLRVTSGAQTYLDMAAVLRPRDLLALGDALMRAGVLDRPALCARLARAERVRGVIAARAWAPRLDGRAGSHRESWLRYWLLTSDLPEPQVQVPLLDRWGREVAHADLGYERWKVGLEYEGRQHAAPEQFDRDLDRYSLAAVDGWLTLRFAARHGESAVVDRTRRALLSRGWRPGQPS